jgi:hypothetical protein
MAILYTDNINGNDTTGNGTIATPYKTINKAMTVGTNGDEIRVAGSTFTALPGTCSHTQRGGTTWNTSQSLVGLLAPGDIITYNDPNFGDQKFFYKVFSVTAANFTTDGATNFDENANVTISRIAVTAQQYYTTTASQTFENVNIAGKSQFDIRGGWTNNFTQQNGFTVMNYHSTVTSTAQSGTGFTAVSGAGMYFDRFMLSHLSTGFAGSINTWAPGTLAFVYMPSSTTVFGANPIASATYPNKDLYLSNTRLSSFNSPQFAADGTPALKYNNSWFMRSALVGVSNSTSPIQVTNHFVKGYSIGTAPPSGGINISLQNIFGNVTISSFAAPNTSTFEGVSLSETNNNNVIIINSLNRVGTNAVNLFYSTPSTGSSVMINTPAQNIENVEGDTTTSGWTQMIPAASTSYSALRPSAYIKDSEGFKTVFGAGQILFADPTQTSTGTNSLRLSKPRAVTSSAASFTPFESIFIDSITPKTITIRCKSSIAGTVKFALYPNAKTGNITSGSTTLSWADEDKTVGTDWTDVTYTGLNAFNSNVFLNSFAALCVNTATMPGKYIWIDSVTIS